jgi:hypothetical protein
MEVHHHSHTARRKWTHYFWEFLMLFLAVFCGFLAEWKLEHTIEHQREVQYMKSLVEDLDKDIVIIEKEMESAREQLIGLDSLTRIIYSNSRDSQSVGKLYELQRQYLRPLALNLINRTEVQLKNAGGMRLVRNRAVVDSIIQFWVVTELLFHTRDNINTHRDRAKDLSFSIFNNKYYKDSTGFSAGSYHEQPVLMSTDGNTLIEFANRVSHMRDLLKFNYTSRLLRLLSNAKGLLVLLNREYSL